MFALPPTSAISWTGAHASNRIIVQRFADEARHLAFERLGGLAPGDMDALRELRSRVDPLRRALHLVRPGDIVTGPGAGLIMGSFMYPGRGGRFSRPELEGAYYTAQSQETAIAETVHHQTRALRAANRGPVTLSMQRIQADLMGKLHDVRSWRTSHAELYHPDDYSAPQALGVRLRTAGSDGIVYQSVRHDGGTCAAVFRPRILSDARIAASLSYLWDGSRITVER